MRQLTAIRRLWAWQFRNAVTSGVGPRIAALEGAGTIVNEKAADELQETEEVSRAKSWRF